MKTYKFIYYDKQYNELQTKEVECQHLQHACRLRDNEYANTKLTDLWKIKVYQSNSVKPKTILNPAFQNRINSL